MAVAAAVIAAVGITVSAITKANEQRSQAKARQVAGDQDLSAQKSLLRRQLGESAVSASASGLLGGSFDSVFTSQAIADAQFLGQIQQRTDFEVKSLKNAARSTLLVGFLSAASTVAGGVAGGKQAGAQADAASRQGSKMSAVRTGQPSRGVNIFGSGRAPGARFANTGGTSFRTGF